MLTTQRNLSVASAAAVRITFLSLRHLLLFKRYPLLPIYTKQYIKHVCTHSTIYTPTRIMLRRHGFLQIMVIISFRVTCVILKSWVRFGCLLLKPLSLLDFVLLLLFFYANVGEIL